MKESTMLKRTMVVLGCAGLLLPAAGGADDAETSKPPCCRKPKASQAAEPKTQKLRCTLTDKVVDRCCCVERAGKTHCTLANRDVETCCCRPVDDKDGKATGAGAL